MQIGHALLLLVATLVLSIATATTSGSVYFYTDVNFKGTLFPVDIDTSNKCYSLCKFKQASSVKWIGQFPSTGAINGKTHIAFYPTKNCVETHVDFPIIHGLNSRGKMDLLNSTIEDLGKYHIDNDISSFMIWETSEKIEHGAKMDCPWIM